MLNDLSISHYNPTLRKVNKPWQRGTRRSSSINFPLTWNWVQYPCIPKSMDQLSFAGMGQLNERYSIAAWMAMSLSNYPRVVFFFFSFPTFQCASFFMNLCQTWSIYGCHKNNNSCVPWLKKGTSLWKKMHFTTSHLPLFVEKLNIKYGQKSLKIDTCMASHEFYRSKL